MALKSNLNAILSGYIDSYCLICECKITSQDELKKHISLQVHIKNLQSSQLVEKFKDDQILKVKKGYYCILCNLIFTTLTKIGLHVLEKEHKTNKGTNILKRAGPLISYGNVVIEEKAWQGIVSDMCAVCNAEFEDETDHLADSKHALNLVKNKLEFHEGNIYRKIDDTIFQCLTCNAILPLSDVSTHFDDSEHNLLLKRKKDNIHEDIQKLLSKGGNNENQPKAEVYDYELTNISKSIEGFKSAEETSDESVPSKSVIVSKTLDYETNKSKILESVSMFEKNEVNINFENETALCKKCLENIEFEYTFIEIHIENHLKNPKKRNVGYIPFPCEADIRTQGPKLDDKKPQLPAIAPNAEAKNPSDCNKNHNKIAGKAEETVLKNKVEPKKEDPAEFAKQNNLTYNSGNNNAYCRLCLTRVPASLRSMKEHVVGIAHKKKHDQSSSTTLEQSFSSSTHNDKVGQSSFSTPTSSTSFSSSVYNMTIRKMRTENFLDEVINIDNLFLGSIKVLNNKFCVNASSFHMITENGDRLRCQVCELFISRGEMSSHIKSYAHETQFKKVPVISSFATEFVREVRPGIFHCGFCNMMEANLEDLEIHFQSAEHRAKKEAAAETLTHFRPAIAEYRDRRNLARLINMMHRGLFRRFYDTAF